MFKIKLLLFKTYKSNPATIAFFDGIFISVAINILTSMGAYEGYEKWIALSASIPMLVGAIFLLFWQNAACKLQEHYKIWVDGVKQRNDTVSKNDPKQYDWNAYIGECIKFNKDYKIWANNAKKAIVKVDKNDRHSYDWMAYIQFCKERNDGNEQYRESFLGFPHYSEKHLIGFVLISCVCLLVSVALMIWSFV